LKVLLCSDFLHVLTRVSGIFAPNPPPIDAGLIDADMDRTIAFFENEIDHYNDKPKILCKLIFVLQSIRDYHLPVESLFKTIKPATQTSLKRLYTIMIDDAENKLGFSTDCQAEPKFEDTLNDGSDEDLADESGFAGGIQKWLSPRSPNPPGSQQTNPSGSQQTNPPESPRYFEPTDDERSQSYQPPGPQLTDPSGSEQLETNPPGPQRTDPSGSQQLATNPPGSQQPNRPPSPRYFELTDDERFQSYQNMKVFILLHVLSLASRGESARSQWQMFAAKIMTELDNERFKLCEGIIYSLFLRRQNEVTHVDNELAREALLTISVRKVFQISTEKRVGFVKFFRDMIRLDNYPVTFYFPSTGRVYTQLIKNFHTFVEEIISYIEYLKGLLYDRQRSNCSTPTVRARAVRDFILKLWDVLEVPLRPGSRHATSYWTYSRITNLLTPFREEQSRGRRRRHT
jgi:hypothetical protein